MNKLFLLTLLLVFSACSQKTSAEKLALTDLPEKWYSLTKTESGFVHEYHSDLGHDMIFIENSTFNLVSSMTIVTFDLKDYETQSKFSFLSKGTFKYGGRLEGETPDEGTLSFKWVDKEKGIALWTFEMHGEIIETYWVNEKNRTNFKTIEIE